MLALGKTSQVQVKAYHKVALFFLGNGGELFSQEFLISTYINIESF